MLTMNKLTMKMRLFAAFLLLGLWGADAQTAREQIAAVPERAGGIYHSYEYRPAAAAPAPDGYTPFYISHYGRHGSRWHASESVYAGPLKILRKAAEMGYKQFAYLPLFQEDAAKAAEHSILPSDKREIAMLTTQFLSSSHFSSMMLDRFQSEIEHLHSCTTIHRISPIELKEKKLPSSLNIQRTAGIICIEVFDYDYAQMLCDLDVPLLFVDTPVMDMRPPLKADRLYMENRIEVQNAVAHMVQRGKKRISFAGDKNHCQSFFERYMAYKDAVEYFGLTEGLSTCAMPSGQQNYPVSLYETIRRFKTMPDAFVCANDFVAMDLVKALNELGYSVPDDIWVCGFDDSQEASYFAPHLTSIHIHGQIMGYTAANLLMTRIEEPSLNYRTVYTETNLILRESTGD